ncbi:acid protease [Annulohypoxylon bovei var. microspora]|nr:acid protease [Annulohypoxylon bovei var. microspora]
MTLVSLLQLIALAVTVHATDCEEISPFQVSIRDIQVIPETPNSLMKGIAATVGTPPQNIVLLPWPELNNTWIYDQGYCDSAYVQSASKCQAWRGNYYQESKSSTWVKENDIAVAGGAPVELETQKEAGIDKLISTSLGGTDEFVLNITEGLAKFPIGIPTMNWDNGYTMLHAMGMGKNSTILNALFKAKRIGSRVWSIYWGRMWVTDRDPIDGSVAFGGYDQQKTIGSNYTQSLDFSETTGCWTGMKVRISKITLHNPDIHDVGLLEPSTELVACIVPQHQLLLEGPVSILNWFEYYTQKAKYGISSGLYKDASLYNESNTFGGDLTISLSTGLDIRVSNDQYLTPFVDIDEYGSRVVDTSYRELLISNVSDPVATLGRYFLTAAYLMVDMDANTFTLWQANPTSDSKLVGLANSGCGNATSPDSGTSPSSNSQAPQVMSGLSRGSIAGIVVGAVAGFAILGLGVFFYLRRIRRFRSNQTATELPDPSGEVSRLPELAVLNNAKPLSSPERELRGSTAVSDVNGQAHHTPYEMDGNTLRGG